MTIFIGYSSKDRYSIVESIIFHLKNYGFKVWYDFHDMFLSDNRNEINFNIGINESKYLIFIISENLFTSKCGMEELDHSRKLYEKQNVTLFPIFYNYRADNLPQEYNWIRKIIYNETTTKTGTLFVVNQIIEKILHDQINLQKHKNFGNLIYSLNTNNNYIVQLLKSLDNIDLSNYNTRLGIQYSLYLYINNEMKDILKHTYCHKVISRIYTMTRLNIEIDHLTFSLFEKSILILLNQYLSD